MNLTPDKNYETGRKGAQGELMVTADLLKRGYEVWRAVSGHAACDLVTEITGRLYKVEVRTVSRQVDGGVNSHGGLLSRKGLHILAVYDRITGAIRYFAEDGNPHIDFIDSAAFPQLSMGQQLQILNEQLRRTDFTKIPREYRHEVWEDIQDLSKRFERIRENIVEATLAGAKAALAASLED